MNENVWRVLSKSGPIAVVAGVLLYVLILDVRADQKATRQEHAESRAEAIASEAATKSVLDRILEVQQRAERTSNYLQRRQCINTARTEEQRNACAKDQ